MNSKYPFIPKSNLKLLPGHFWPIVLKDGLYACGVVLGIPLSARPNNVIFVAGLLNWTGTQKPTQVDLESTKLQILDRGKAHVKTITSAGESIIGILDLFNCGLGNAINGQSLDSTWGYDFINLRAKSYFLKSGSIDASSN